GCWSNRNTTLPSRPVSPWVRLTASFQSFSATVRSTRAERAVGDQGDQLAVGAVHLRGVGASQPVDFPESGPVHVAADQIEDVGRVSLPGQNCIRHQCPAEA